jgi:uncharacterized membrane protein YeaQ/YmgE (transglycosylase-associated protein family)
MVSPVVDGNGVLTDRAVDPRSHIGHPHNVFDSGGQFMGIFSIIGTIIVGFIVGVLARWIFPGTVPLGFWLTVGLGIGGSVVGGVISDLIFKSPDGKFHPAGWIVSIGGALLLLWGYTHYMV